MDKKTDFRAKEIREILGISKSRYDHIFAKIKIVPDIQKGCGTGKVNIFSFKKLLEIAIASKGIDIGMVIEDLICSLTQIKFIDSSERWGLFSYKNSGVSISFSHGLCTDGKFYRFAGDVNDDFLSGNRFCTFHPHKRYSGKKIVPIACSTLYVSEIKKELLTKL